MIKLVKAVENTCRTYGISINAETTKLLVIADDPHPSNIVIDNRRLERVDRYMCLGAWINKDGPAFMNIKKVLATHDMTLALKIRILKCCAWPVLLYGVET